MAGAVDRGLFWLVFLLWWWFGVMGAEQKLGGLSRAGHVGVGGHVAVQAQGHPSMPRNPMEKASAG